VCGRAGVDTEVRRLDTLADEAFGLVQQAVGLLALVGHPFGVHATGTERRRPGMDRDHVHRVVGRR
jgi:hypothetical protein